MELSTYITSFREVNSIYTKFIETGLYGFDEQEIIINFFEEIKDIKKLEKVLFESSEALNFQSKFNAFKIVLNDNVKLYEGNKELFDALDVDKLCGIKSSCFDENISLKQKEVDVLFKDYWLSRGNLGDRFFKKAEENEHDPIWEEYIYKKQLYDWKNKELDALHKKREHILYYVLPYIYNKFSEISILSNSFLSILNSYELKIKLSQNEVYFDSELTGALYKICNDFIFETMDEISFYYEINLINTENKLVIKGDNIMKVYYLIFKLKDKIEEDKKRTEWIKNILVKLGLKMKNYNSKASSIDKEPTETLKAFMNDIKTILSKKRK